MGLENVKTVERMTAEYVACNNWKMMLDYRAIEDFDLSTGGNVLVKSNHGVVDTVDKDGRCLKYDSAHFLFVTWST